MGQKESEIIRKNTESFSAVLYEDICICDCSNCLSAGAQHATVNPGPTEELNRFIVRCSL